MKVDINKLMKYPSRASEDLGAIDFADDQDIYECVEKVMMIDEEAKYEELPMDEPMGESSTRRPKESRSNGYDERERRGNPDAPTDEVEGLHRLPEAELRY